MRKVDESRAANYIRKHSNYKKWLAFVLCLSLLTGTITLYTLNKPATAMTEDGAKEVGIVLDTNDAEFERELIEQMNEQEEEDESEDYEEDDSQDDSDDSDDGDGSGDEEGEDTEESEEPEEGAEESEEETESEDEEKKEKSESEDELTEDVVLTASYVDENGETILEDKEIHISGSFDLTEKAPIIDGYEFKEASYNGDVITCITALTTDDEIKYYEVTFEDDETKEIKKDATVVFTYTAVEEEIEVESPIVLTAKYVDRNGEEIQDSEEVSFAKETSIDKDNAPEVEGYYFIKATYDGQEIVKITPIEGEEEAKEETEDMEETSEEEKEEKPASVEAYEFTTADGETVKITEDAEIQFSYMKANTQDTFEFVNDEYTVTITLSNPGVLPDGVELNVATVDKDSEGYNYEAYIAALNENAEKIMTANGEEVDTDSLDDEESLYNENNTVLFDIAFMLDGIEYEPKDGTVSVSIRFNNNQISDDLGADEAQEVAVVHLPISEDIMQEVNATVDATEITSSDVSVDILTDSTISLEGSTDLVSFEAASFSVYAAVRTIIPGTYTWTGAGLNDNTATGIVSSLGQAVYFGVVADTFDATSHFESNIAVNKIGSGLGTNTVFDYSDYIGRNPEYTEFNISVVKKSTAPGTFSFGLFENADGTGTPVEKFTIAADNLVDGWYQGKYDCKNSLRGKKNLFVFELDENGAAKKSGENIGTYKVEYSSDLGSSNDLADSLLSSYIMNPPNDEAYLKKILKNGSSIYHPVTGGYERIRKLSDADNVPLDRTTFKGDIAIHPDQLLRDAEALSRELPHAIDSDSVEVLNVIANDKNYEKDIVRAYWEKKGQPFNRYDDNQTNNVIKNGIYSESELKGKLLVINLDLTGLDSYAVQYFKIAGHNSADKFDPMDSRIIINPVKKVSETEYVPFDGTFTVDYAMGTLLAPKASVVENGINGAIIGKDVLVGSGEIHKYTLMKILDIGGTVTVTNSGKEVPKGKIVKTWVGNTAYPAYPFIYAYVRATAYTKNLIGRVSEYKDLPQYSTLIELGYGNTWSSEVTFPFDTYTEGERTYNIAYRVVEVNAFKNGVSGDIYTKDELQSKLQAGVTVNDAGTSLFIYDDTDGISDLVNGYFTSYSSNITAGFSMDGSDRMIFYTDNETADRTVTITNTQMLPYELYAYKLVDGQPANANQIFSYTLKFWNGSTWTTLAADLHNGQKRTDSANTEIEPYKIGYTVYPQNLNMQAGSDYYFLLTENDTTGTGYTGDTAKILVVIHNTQNNTASASNSVDYYLYKSTDNKFGKLDNTFDEGDSDHIKTSTDIEQPDNIPVFKNLSTTKVVVTKQWGEEGDTGAAALAFDIDVALFRYTKDVSKAVKVGESMTIKKDDPTKTVEFTDLEKFDDKGNEYVYFVKEYCGTKEFVSGEDGNVINEFKLKSITPFEVTGGQGYLLTNVPVITLEKEWTKNAQPLNKTEGVVTVRLYQKKGIKTNKIGDYQLGANKDQDKNWKQVVEVPRGYDDEEYTYYIVELKLDGSEADESPLITYEASDGDGTRSGTVAKDVYVSAKSGAVLKLKVINEVGDNVLPSAGGIGDIPYMAAGAGTAVIGLLGTGLYYKKKKDEDQEEE